MGWSDKVASTDETPSALECVGYGESAIAPARIVIVGCGNLLRGDDALGPILVRDLADFDLGQDVRLVDGGTAGIDVGFWMRGVDEAIIIDIATSGSRPGTLFRVPGEEVMELPPLDAVHSHSIRWDHSLAIAKWLLGNEMPSKITVYLVEGSSFEFGAPLSEEVGQAKQLLMTQIVGHVKEATGV